MKESSVVKTPLPWSAEANYSNPLYRYYALSIFTFALALSFVDRQVLVILQESIKADLDISDTQLGLLTGIAFSVFHVTDGIPIARLADTSVRRTIVSVSIDVWIVMTALCGLAGNFWQLFTRVSEFVLEKLDVLPLSPYDF